MLFIRAAHPSPACGSLCSRRCLFRLSFAPCLMGGKTGRFALSGGRDYAAFRVSPLPSPDGGNGRKRREGSRWVRVASVGRCKASPRLCRSAPPAPLVLDTAPVLRRFDTRRKRVHKHSSGAPDPVRKQYMPFFDNTNQMRYHSSMVSNVSLIPQVRRLPRPIAPSTPSSLCSLLSRHRSAPRRTRANIGITIIVSERPQDRRSAALSPASTATTAFGGRGLRLAGGSASGKDRVTSPPSKT